MEKIETALLSAAAVVGFAFLPSVAAAAEFESCVDYVASAGPVKAAIGVAFLATLVVFGFLKKSLPGWIKDVVLSILGKKTTP